MRQPIFRFIGILLCAAVAVSAQGPNQQTEDALHWAGLSGGGVSLRPWVSALSVIPAPGDTPIVQWTGLTSSAQSPPASAGTQGKITATVYATNMCAVNGSTDGCYASPNRIAVSLAVSDSGSTSSFSDTVTTGFTVTEDTVFDITVEMNAFASTASWMWVNGVMEYLSVSSTALRIKLSPSLFPWVSSFPDGNGCTATPIRDCDVQTPDSLKLVANFFVSVDATGGSSRLPGVAFATTGAIIGYMFPSGASLNPVLNYQLSGPHFKPGGGELQLGTLRAVLPMSIVESLYPDFTSGSNPSTFFNVTRTGSIGTQESITFATWTADVHGTAGVAFDVSGVTFSTPTYSMAPPQSNGASVSASGVEFTVFVALAAAFVFSLL